MYMYHKFWLHNVFTAQIMTLLCIYRLKLNDVMQRERDCLFEIISTIFFGENYNNPSQEVIAELVKYVFEGVDRATFDSSLPCKTDAVNPATTTCTKIDSNSFSFLLQLLIEYE